MAKSKKQSTSESSVIQSWVKTNEDKLGEVRVANPELYSSVVLTLDYLNKYLGGASALEMPEIKEPLKVGDIVVTPKFEISPNSPFGSEQVDKIKGFLKYKKYDPEANDEIPFMTVTKITEYEGQNFVELMPIWWRISKPPEGLIKEIFPTWKIEEEKLTKINYDLRMGDRIKVPKTKNGKPLGGGEIDAIDNAREGVGSLFLTRIQNAPNLNYNSVLLGDSMFGFKGYDFNIELDNLQPTVAFSYVKNYDDELDALKLLCTVLRLEKNRVLVSTNTTTNNQLFMFITDIDIRKKIIVYRLQGSTTVLAEAEAELKSALDFIFGEIGVPLITDAPQNYEFKTVGYNAKTKGDVTLKNLKYSNSLGWEFIVEDKNGGTEEISQNTWNEMVDEYTNQKGTNIPNVSQKNVSLGVTNPNESKAIADLADELDNLDI